MTNVIVILIVAAIVGVAIAYIVKEKKKVQNVSDVHRQVHVLMAENAVKKGRFDMYPLYWTNQ